MLIGAGVAIVALGVGVVLFGRSGERPNATESRSAGDGGRVAVLTDGGRAVGAGVGRDRGCLARREGLRGEGAPRLLFCSGFEDPVGLGEPEAMTVAQGRSRRVLTGGDVEGYAWPMRLGGNGGYVERVEESTRQRAGVSDGGVRARGAELVEADGHGGRNSRVMRLSLGSEGAEAAVRYVVPGVRSEGGIYVRYWMRFGGTPLVQEQWPVQAAPWRAVSRWESSHDGGVEKVELFIYGRARPDAGAAENLAYWHAKNEDTAGARTWWIVDGEGSDRSDGGVGGVPWGRWFLFELGIRADEMGAQGYWVAVDGHRVLTLPAGYRVFSQGETGTLVPFELGGWPTPMEQEIDDVEIWSAPPCETAPCGLDG